MQRILEPEVMDTWEEAVEYDSMDFTDVNAAFSQLAVTLGPETGQILDAGTGTARIPVMLGKLRPGWQIIGIDLSENMLKIGRRNIEESGLAGQIQLDAIDAKAMPYPDRSFDMVISNSILHHLPDPLPFLAGIQRVLKPNGALLLRDLLRPIDVAARDRLVELYAGDCNAHQKQLFSDSLQAAFTLPEVADMMQAVQLEGVTLYQSSDRHWTVERNWQSPNLRP